jgi:hypothetical protein
VLTKAIFDVFTAIKNQVVAFWVVKRRSDVVEGTLLDTALSYFNQIYTLTQYLHKFHLNITP